MSDKQWEQVVQRVVHDFYPDGPEAIAREAIKAALSILVDSEPPSIFAEGTWTWSGDGCAYDSRELDAAAWHKLRAFPSATEPRRLLAKARDELRIIASYADDENTPTGLRLTAHAYRRLVGEIDAFLAPVDSSAKETK
jgi:hypothetical protein